VCGGQGLVVVVHGVNEGGEDECADEGEGYQGGGEPKPVAAGGPLEEEVGEHEDESGADDKVAEAGACVRGPGAPGLEADAEVEGDGVSDGGGRKQGEKEDKSDEESGEDGGTEPSAAAFAGDGSGQAGGCACGEEEPEDEEHPELRAEVEPVEGAIEGDGLLEFVGGELIGGRLGRLLSQAGGD